MYRRIHAGHHLSLANSWGLKEAVADVYAKFRGAMKFCCRSKRGKGQQATEEGTRKSVTETRPPVAFFGTPSFLSFPSSAAYKFNVQV